MTASTRLHASWWLLILIAILIASIGGQLNRAINNDIVMQSILKEAKQWQQVIEDSDTAFVVFDSNHEIVQWNRGAQLILGWSEAEAVGAKITLIIPTERYEQGVWNEPNLKQAIHKTIEVDGYILNKNGQILSSNIRIIAVVNSKILYVIQIVKLEQLTLIDNNHIGSELAKPHKIEQFRIRNE